MNYAFVASRLVAVTVALLVPLCGPALADSGLRLDYKTITLDNGLKVITLEDFTTPIVNVQLWYHVGSKDEDPERQGFAHMFEHMMFRGTDRLGPTDHFDLIRRTGGTTNAYTSFDQTVYHETLPANQLELALWLESERMAWLKIDQQSFDTERQVVEEERRLGVNGPYGTLPEKLLAEAFKVHPYRWSPIGNIAHLRATAVPELRAFWTRYYVPNNATLVIVGAVTHQRAQELAHKYFGWIPRYPDPPRITVREPQPTEPKSMVIKEDNAPAPLVGIGTRTVPAGHPDEIPLQLLGSILGEGKSSRAYRELVAEKELAVMAMGGAESLEHDGFIGIGAALSPTGGDPAKTLAALEAILEKARTEPVSERELEKARNRMLKEIVEESLTAQGRASALGRAAVLEGDVAKVNARLEAVRRTTADDLLRVAQEYLAPQRLLKVTVERNLMGTLGGLLGFKKREENPPITAKPETDPPPPGRPGLQRPAGFPTTAPVAEPITYDPTPRYESFTLANGLKVLVIENHKAPLVTVQLGLRSGAWCEEKPGAASMALQMLTRGTAQHSERELADELEIHAISLTGQTNMDDSTVTASCLTEHLDRAVQLLAEVVRTPTFPENEFRKLRRQVRTDLAISTAEPSYIASRELRRRLYGRHPYARTATGEIEDVDALQVADARQWWQRFARPDMAALIFAGDITRERAQRLAEATFDDWRAEGPAPTVALPPVPEPGPTHIYLVDRPGVQSQIRAGRSLDLTRNSPGYFVSRVVSEYFGGAFSSRLNETIRVKKGLTYGASGGYNARRFAGGFTLSTFSQTARTPEAVQAILDEVRRLTAEPPSARELETIKSYTLGSFPREREAPAQIVDDLWLIESCDLPGDYLQKLLAGVARADAAECMRLIGETVDPARLTIVVVGPARELRKELEQIAPVTVVGLDTAASTPGTRAE